MNRKERIIEWIQLIQNEISDLSFENPTSNQKKALERINDNLNDAIELLDSNIFDE